MEQSESQITSSPATVPSRVAQESAALRVIPLLRRRTLALAGFPMAWFFVNHYMIIPRGLYQAFFWPLFLLLGFWFLRDRIARKEILLLLSSVAVLAGSVRAALYASEPLTILNFFALPILAVFSLLLAVSDHDRLSLRPYLDTLDCLLTAPLRNLIHLPAFFRNGQTGQQRTEDPTRRKEILTGTLLALPLVVTLFVLLTQADAGFDQTLGGFLRDLIDRFQLSESLWRLIISLAALLYFISVMISVHLSQARSQALTLPGKPHSPTISLIILWSVNALYLVFTATQLRTLYFPREVLTAQNQNIAQYARSGFFSLLLVLAINLLLLWFLSSYTVRTEASAFPMKAGYFLLILFTANMIASSFYKMHLYESEYGYTHLRLFVKFALIFFTLCLPLLIAFISGAARQILKNVTLLALAVYIVMNLVNLDGLIAARASSIYATNGRLDTAYLSELSADASSALARAFAFDTTADPRILDLKSRYVLNITTQLKEPGFKDHPLARSLSEFRFKP